MDLSDDELEATKKIPCKKIKIHKNYIPVEVQQSDTYKTMTDEEKAVLKTAKENYGLTSAEQKILVNLIQKQSKEIEELKNEVMEKELIIVGMKEDRRIAVEEIQEQYYISKDKIKAKIEKLKVLAEKSDDETFNYCELDIRKNQIYLLKSLLEKEE